MTEPLNCCNCCPQNIAAVCDCPKQEYLAELKASVLHKKCPIIKLVKNQINRFAQSSNQFKKPSKYSRLARLVKLILISTLIWILALYLLLVVTSIVNGLCKSPNFIESRSCGLLGWMTRLPGVSWKRPAQYTF